MSQDNESDSSKVFGPKNETRMKGENDENKDLENNRPECNLEGDIPESETNIKEENDESKEFKNTHEPSSLETSSQIGPSSVETSENENSAATDNLPLLLEH
ncbi:hypothetical protein HPULCUR_006314 [Helicostylum pulchrum]|uniref:Uncharacterized protein n=1 Tax=Helicostylum pulchrum TaxID=562976 RepID=A0ABP9Y2D9_9FUNG